MKGLNSQISVEGLTNQVQEIFDNPLQGSDSKVDLLSSDVGIVLSDNDNHSEFIVNHINSRIKSTDDIGKGVNIEYIEIDTRRISNLTKRYMNSLLDKIMSGESGYYNFAGKYRVWCTPEDFERLLDIQLDLLTNPTYASFEEIFLRGEKFVDGSLQTVGGGAQAVVGYGIATVGSWSLITVPTGIIVGADGVSNGYEGLEKMYDAVFTPVEDESFDTSYNIIRDWAFKGILGEESGEKAYNYFTLGTGIIAFSKTVYDITKSGAIKNIVRKRQTAKAQKLNIPQKNRIIRFDNKIIIHTVEATSNSGTPMITRKIFIDIEKLAKDGIFIGVDFRNNTNTLNSIIDK